MRLVKYGEVVKAVVELVVLKDEAEIEQRYGVPITPMQRQ